MLSKLCYWNPHVNRIGIFRRKKHFSKNCIKLKYHFSKTALVCLTFSPVTCWTRSSLTDRRKKFKCGCKILCKFFGILENESKNFFGIFQKIVVNFENIVVATSYIWALVKETLCWKLDILELHFLLMTVKIYLLFHIKPIFSN